MTTEHHQTTAVQCCRPSNSATLYQVKNTEVNWQINAELTKE